MNPREKFLSVMREHNSVEIPKVEMGYWAGTIRRWGDEGMPIICPLPADIFDGDAVVGSKNIYETMEKKNDVNVQPFFDLDSYITKFPTDMSPMFKKEVIEQTDEFIIYKDSFGVLCKNDTNMSSLPMELENPVKDWNTWNEYKQHYSVNTIEKRLPLDWDNVVKKLKCRDYPIRLGGTYAGFLGFPRQIMGVTDYLITLYDDPTLIHDICDTLLEFLIEYYARILRDVDIDCILIWEDMAGKQGSLISPAHFNEFLAPRYKALIRHVKDFGIDIILNDTDGYVEELIPLMVETGVTGMYPFERAAGNNLLKIRDSFPDLQIIGGFDKRVLFEDSSKQDIDNELKMVEYMLKKGRFIPHIDHYASSDCTWEHFKYYRNRLNEIIDNLK